MDTVNQRNYIIQNTVYAFILSLFFPLIGISIDLMTNKNIEFNLNGIKTIYSQNPLHWIILMALIVLPLVSLYFSYKYIKDISRKQNQLDSELDRMNSINLFTQKLIENDFSHTLDAGGEDDSLGRSLINLRDALKKNKEAQDKRIQEDEQRNWIAEGLAKFGDILRANSDNMEQLSFRVIKELVKYINAIQGSFYLLNNDDPDNLYFDQTALFAYDRKKFTDTKIKWGDGLVGTCALERQTIYMTKIPDSYVKITSGLGLSNPRCLLLVPLLSENELYGVIEFASYNTLKIHEINFVERVAESIAATIASVRANIRTSMLLEESKERTHAMSAQEEEMRQNMEELQATQEELARQADKFIKLENTVNHTMIRADYAVDGTLLYANTKFLKKLEYFSNSEVEGQQISLFIGEKDKVWFNQLWEDLANGGRHYEGYMKHVTKNGKDLWTMATYTCIKGENNNVEKILFLAIDTTEHKKQSLRLESIVDAVDKSSIKLEMGSNGSINVFNDNTLYLFGFNDKEAKNLTIFDLIDPLEIENFNNKWDTVVKGIAFQGQFKMKSKSDEILWLRGAFSAVYDMYGDVTLIVFIGHDITNEKMMDIELRQQTDILKKQEKMLRESEKELSRKLREARIEMQNQFKEIEKIKLRNERTLEGALDAIFTIGNDNKIIFFNNAAEELWGYKKEDVIGHDVAILFNAHIIEDDDFLVNFVEPGNNKIVGVRKEIKIFTKQGDEKPVLILLSNAQVEKENTFTAFIQNVEVELF